MSYEGYVRRLCASGHQRVYDRWAAEDEEAQRCSCGALFVWRRDVDETNGHDHASDPPLVLKTQATMCQCSCGHVHVLVEETYEQPPSTNAVGQCPDDPTCVRAPEPEALSEVLSAGRLVDPSPPQPIRERFAALCTNRQKTCPHGWRDRVERCIHCVISEGASVLAVNRMLTEGVTDASVDAYLAIANSQDSAARVDPSPLAQLSENKDDQARVVSVPGSEHGDLPRPATE